jgi:Ca2+-binding EF-hand superfamily protein
MSKTLKNILKDKKTLHYLADSAFESVDSDNSGFITEDELFIILNCISKELGLNEPSEDEAQQILSIMDIDRSGKLDRKEFRVLFKKILEAALDIC